MRKWVAFALAILILFGTAVTTAGETEMSDAVMGYAENAQTGRIEAFVLYELPADQEPDAEQVLDALIAHQSWSMNATLSIADGFASVGFEAGSYPTTGASSLEERTALDAIARTLLLNVAALNAVGFSVDGNAYISGHFLLEPGEAYLTRTQLNYNSNIDGLTGRYIDPMSDPPEDAPEDSLPHVTPGYYPLSDEGYLSELAYGAFDLMSLVAGLIDSDTRSFSGAPSADFAWRLISDFYLNLSGSEDIGFVFGVIQQDGISRVSPERITAAYDALFAYGRVPGQPDTSEGLALTREADQYALSGEPDASAPTPIINGVTANEYGEVVVDLSILTPTENEPGFKLNAKVALLPDSEAVFGVKISGVTIDGYAPAFAEAAVVRVTGEATGEVQDINALADGDVKSGWLLDESGDLVALALTNSVVQQVRGLCLAPLTLADSGTIAEIRVTLSDGNIYEQPFADGVSAWVSMPFEGVHDITWMRIELIPLAEDAGPIGISELRAY